MPAVTRMLNVARAPTPEGLARLQEFVDAFASGVILGMVGSIARSPETAASAAIDWSAAGIVTMAIDVEGVPLTGTDEDLLVRGTANCLDMLGIDVVGGPPAAPPAERAYAEALRQQRSRMACEVFEDERWHHAEPSHVVLEFAQSLDESMVRECASMTGVFEKLVWGMYPLPGDTYSDMGDTSLVHLEGHLVRYWIDGIFALPEDWKRRLEAALLLNRARFDLREVRYEP